MVRRSGQGNSLTGEAQSVRPTDEPSLAVTATVAPWMARWPLLQMPYPNAMPEGYTRTAIQVTEFPVVSIF